MKNDMEFQTRSHSGELLYFQTLKEALNEFHEDSNIWKVSFSLPNGERVRLIRNEDDGLVLDLLEVYIDKESNEN